MSGSRVPFDPDLPFVVATQDGLPIGGRVVARGRPFPWRELGVSVFDLLQLYRYFKVDCVAAAPLSAETSIAPPVATRPTKRQARAQRAE